jgi:hypothetical protein
MKPIHALLSFVGGFLAIYLVGSFACADFNIARWSAGERAFIAFFGVMAGVLCAAFAMETK